MAKRKIARKSTKRKTARKMSKDTSKEANRNALWQTYRELQNQADQAWHKFRADVKNEAKSDILLRDHNHLLLLLGECNYMARECMRFAARQRRR